MIKNEFKITIPLNPATKKNSSRIVKVGKYHKLLPSKTYEKYEKECKPFLVAFKNMKIDCPVNVEAHYYRATKHRVDLCNLHEALCDVLVKYGVVADDNIKVIATMDGSEVFYDKEFPRTEITITKKDESYKTPF